MRGNPQTSSWFKVGYALSHWLLGSFLFWVLFFLFGWLAGFITRPRPSSGDAAALTALGFIPYFSLVGLVYFAFSVWSILAAWFSRDLTRQRRRVSIAALCCGALLGCGFAVVARLLFGADHA